MGRTINNVVEFVNFHYVSFEKEYTFDNFVQQFWTSGRQKVAAWSIRTRTATSSVLVPVKKVCIPLFYDLFGKSIITPSIFVQFY